MKFAAEMFVALLVSLVLLLVLSGSLWTFIAGCLTALAIPFGIAYGILVLLELLN